MMCKDRGLSMYRDKLQDVVATSIVRSFVILWKKIRSPPESWHAEVSPSLAKPNRLRAFT